MTKTGLPQNILFVVIDGYLFGGECEPASID